MKKLLLMLLAFVPFISNAQEFDLTPEGYKPVVVEFEDKSSEQIYNSVIKYINRNYKNPSEVLKGDIKNEYVRFDGFQESMWCYKSIGITTCTDQSYTIEIDIKDGRFRMSLILNQGYVAGTSNKLLYTYATFYRKDGSIRKVYSGAKESLDLSVNKILQSIIDEVEGISESNDDW